MIPRIINRESAVAVLHTQAWIMRAHLHHPRFQRPANDF
jgi:hypothetical protein